MKKLLSVCIAALLASSFGCGKTISDGFSVDKKTGLDVNWDDLMGVSDGANLGNFKMPITVGGNTTFAGTENNVDGEKFTDQTGVSFHVINGNVEAFRGRYYADNVTPYDPDYPMPNPYDSAEDQIWWKSSFVTGRWIDTTFYDDMIRNTNTGSPENSEDDYLEQYKGISAADLAGGNITHQLIWYAFNNPNYGLPEDGFGTNGYSDADNAKYTFDISYSASFIVSGTGLNPDEDFSTDPADLNDTWNGQVAGMTIGFVDADLNQNGGILVKAFDAGAANDYLLLQVPDVTADGAIMNVPYTLDGDEIVQGTEFKVEIILSGSSITAGPNITVYVNDVLRSPDDTASPFNEDDYGTYCSGGVLGLGIIEAALGKPAWSALWEGGSALGNVIPGCINPKTERAVYIIDLGVNLDGTNAWQRSAQVVRMEVKTDPVVE